MSRWRMSGIICALSVLGYGGAAALAQTAPPSEFDAASVKENKDIRDGGTLRFTAGGTGIAAEHALARGLITTAYQLQPFQLIGAPPWVSETAYDVIARTNQPTSREQIVTMLQALLADRFKLSFHRDTRQLDGFSLVMVRPNVFGPTLHPSTIDCTRAFATESRCRMGGISFNGGANSMDLAGRPMSALLQVIVGEVGAPVSDDTQLAGTFDIQLRWSNEVAPSGDLRSIYTALQEQLGLKLERRKVMSEVFVIDHIERPSPD